MPRLFDCVVTLFSYFRLGLRTRKSSDLRGIRWSRIESLEPRTLMAADLVKDINTSANLAGSDPRDCIEVNGAVFFSATVAGLGNELWKSDGTSEGTVLVKDIRSGTSSSNPGFFANVNGTVFSVQTMVSTVQRSGKVTAQRRVQN